MAQKTLIVALGSTGMKIAVDVLRRIEDEYGSTSCVPWVQAVVLETAQKDTNDRLLEGRVVPLGLDPTVFSTALNNFESGNGMALGEWCDPAELRRAESLGGTFDGAGNLRMIGRFSFLHPSNGQKIRPVLDAAVGRLQSLSAIAASQAMEELPWGGKPNVLFGPTPGAMGSVEIFVCGTLTGGTCSGSFIDVGYYLRAAGLGQGGSVGMFLVPHENNPQEIANANAYAAMTELNHYHTAGTRYTAQFSSLGRGVDEAGPPFKSVFLCSPRVPNSQGVDDAVRSIGQFIYLQAVTEVGAAARAQLINPGMVYAASKDTEGNPVSFNSMGVSVIEYPAAHIVKGCTARLLERSLQLWSSRTGLQEGAGAGHLAQRDGLDPQTLATHLMQAGEGATSSLDALLRTEIDRAVTNARENAMAEAAAAEAAIEVGFNASAPATGHAITPGLFLETIRKNGDAQVAGRRADVQRSLREALLDADRGLVWAKDYVKILTALTSRALADLATQADDLKATQSQAKIDVDHARARVTESHRAGGLFPLLYRPAAVSITVAEYEDALSGLFEARLRTTVNAQLNRLWSEMARSAASFSVRLNDPNQGLEIATNDLRARLTREADALDAAPPQANGKVLFEPGVTIQEEYLQEISHAQAEQGAGFGAIIQGEEFAKRAVIADWANLMDDVVAVKSTFDPTLSTTEHRRTLRPDDYESPRLRARNFFIGLMRTNVLDAPAMQAHLQGMIDEAIGLSAASLAINGNPRDEIGRTNLQFTNPQFAFFRDHEVAPATGANSTQASRLAFFLHNHPGLQIEGLQEPYRIAFVTARAAFSLSMIEGMRPEGSRTFWHAHQSEVKRDRRSFNSRIFKRGGWRSVESSLPDPGLPLTRAKLLVALAIGRAGVDANGLWLKWSPNPGDVMPLGHSLDDAAMELRRGAPDGGSVHAPVLASLDQMLREREGNQAELARALTILHNAIPNYGLTSVDKPVDKEEAKKLLKPYVATIPGLRENLNAIYPVVPQRSDYLVQDKNGTSYYACRTCDKFLMSGNSTAPLPSNCPACQTPLTI